MANPVILVFLQRPKHYPPSPLWQNLEYWFFFSAQNITLHVHYGKPCNIGFSSAPKTLPSKSTMANPVILVFLQRPKHYPPSPLWQNLEYWFFFSAQNITLHVHYGKPCNIGFSSAPKTLPSTSTMANRGFDIVIND